MTAFLRIGSSGILVCVTTRYNNLLNLWGVVKIETDFGLVSSSQVLNLSFANKRKYFGLSRKCRGH